MTNYAVGTVCEFLRFAKIRKYMYFHNANISTSQTFPLIKYVNNKTTTINIQDEMKI